MQFVSPPPHWIASLRFQPTKRPQPSSQKPKPKHALPKAAPQPIPSQPSAPAKSTMSDWTSRAEDDQEYYYGGNKRQRGGRKKRKKNPHEPVHVAEDWNAPYDPTWPTNYQEYRHSDEKIREVREWKDHLYRHRMRRSPTRDSDSEDDNRPINRMPRPLHNHHSQEKANCSLRTICTSYQLCASAQSQRCTPTPTGCCPGPA